MTLYNNLCKLAQLDTSPAYYLGRGACRSDLGGDKLEAVYQEIKQKAGEDPARNYVQMVADIPVLSATEFLVNLKNLEDGGWRAGPGLQTQRQKTKLIQEDEMKGAGSIIFAVVANGNNRGNDETSAIRGAFLQSHRGEYTRGRVNGGAEATFKNTPD